MVALPADVYHQIFDFLPTKTLASCRLLNKYVCKIATDFTFRHIRLEAARDVSSFLHIAESNALRGLVREITIDTWVGPDFEYHKNETFHPPRPFFRALPFLRYFTALKTLNLRFNRWCGNEDADNYTGCGVEEDYDFRYVVLDVVFGCLAGKWSAERQALQERRMIPFDSDSQDEDFDGNQEAASDASPEAPSPTSGTQANQPIELNALTISNLADYNDPRLTSSDNFKQVMSSKSLTELKLFVTLEQVDSAPESTIHLPEKYDFFETLPKTWLSPSVAQNLRVLSLFSRDYWGWNPKLDFRTINPGTGPSSGFPNLRVLALGNYVFSHEWQIDWIASVGRQNGRGGLEELYLDDCPIMWQARTLTLLDQSSTTCESLDGERIEFSNEGYLSKDAMVAGPGLNNNWNPAKFSSHLRWSRVLDHWKYSMVGLKVFKMGHGSFGDEDLVMNANFGSRPLTETNEAPGDLNVGEEMERWDSEYPFRLASLMDNEFLTYDCPSPPEGPIPGGHSVSTYIYGAGLRYNREYILQYVHFDLGVGPTPWIERDMARDMIQEREEGLQDYEAARRLDEEAYGQLMEITQQRSFAGKGRK